MNDMWISVVVRDGTPVRVDANTVLRAGDDVLVLAEPDHDTSALFGVDRNVDGLSACYRR
jgi:hypothetical protein